MTSTSADPSNPRNRLNSLSVRTSPRNESLRSISEKASMFTRGNSSGFDENLPYGNYVSSESICTSRQKGNLIRPSETAATRISCARTTPAAASSCSPNAACAQSKCGCSDGHGHTCSPERLSRVSVMVLPNPHHPMPCKGDGDRPQRKLEVGARDVSERRPWTDGRADGESAGSHFEDGQRTLQVLRCGSGGSTFQ